MGKISLNKLMHNTKAMLAFSLIAAIAIWIAVISGPGNNVTRELTINTKIDITGISIGADGSRMQVIGNDETSVKVVIAGPFSVVAKLTSNDILIRANANGVVKPGTYSLPLTATPNLTVTGYEITSFSPAKATVNLDYWDETGPISVDVNTDSLKTDSPQKVLGTPFVDTSQVKLEGPRKIISNVASVSAVILADTLSENKTYECILKAFDKDKNELDLTNCDFIDLPDGKVNVTVPILISQEITLQLPTPLHMPSGLDPQTFMTVTPDKITLLGEQDALDQYAASIASLEQLDFDQIGIDNKEIPLDLKIPSGVGITVKEQITQATVSLNMTGYTSKTITLNFNNPASNDLGIFNFINVPAGKPVSVVNTGLSVTLVGPAKTLAGLTAKDLSITLDMGGGASAFSARVDIPGYNDVWVRYPDGTHGFDIYTN